MSPPMSQRRGQGAIDTHGVDWRWLLAALAAGVTEIIIDGVRTRATSPSYVSYSATSIAFFACGHIAFQSVALALGGTASAVLRLLDPEGKRNARLRWLALSALYFVLLAWPLHRAGVRLTMGAWISEQSFAPLVRVAPLLGGAIACSIVAALVTSARTESRRRRRLVFAALVGGSAIASLADQRVVIGLYPEFHMLAYSTGAIGFLLAAHRLAVEAEQWRIRIPKRALFGIGFVLAASPLALFATSSRTRAELAFYSPTARDWLRVLMPTPRSRHLHAALEELTPVPGTLDLVAKPNERGSLPVPREMNVVFVVVDALRADAVPPNRSEEDSDFASAEDTPVINAFLDSTFRFTHCYSAATATRMAMPVLFRSIEVFEDPVTDGAPAGLRMQGLGLTPVAVVLDWFISGKWPAAGALLDGFEDVVVYEQSENDKVIPHVRELLGNVGDKRFFAWVHFFQVHDPGFDGRLLTSEDGSRKERYRRSLQYLDRSFAELLAILEERGVADKTMVVFVADHGEGLGNHGLQLHGPNLFEEDIRVPLAIYIPGHQGRIIDDVVGTIDVMPTVVELLGGPFSPDDRGESLVPLMSGAASAPRRDYYLQNGETDKFGLVAGSDKIVWEPQTDMIFRSDLVQDPHERRYLWNPDGDVDRELMRRLIEYNPAHVSAELQDPETYALLEQHLAAVDPVRPPAELPFLLRLVGLSPSETTLADTRRIFTATDDWRLRALVLKHIKPTPGDPFDVAVAEWLQEIAGKREENQIISALARQGQTVTARRTIARRMKLLSKKPPSSWEPYLLLTRPWTKERSMFSAPLIAMVDRAQAAPPPGVDGGILEILLDNIASIDGSPPQLAELAAKARPFLEHEDARVRAAALRVAAKAKDPDALSLVSEMLFDPAEKPRVRTEAAQALARIREREALPDLIRAAADPVLTAVVLRILKKLRDPSVLPFLYEQLEAHPSGWIRIEVERLIRDIEPPTGEKPLR